MKILYINQKTTEIKDNEHSGQFNKKELLRRI
jgi:hypothetical protein